MFKSIILKIKSFAYWGELLCALLGVLFVTIVATWESPLYPYSYGYDASFFSMMGRAILEGKVPYRDYFDIKGPVFFFIEAIGQFFVKGRVGVYLLECIATASSFVILYKICRFYKLSIKKTAFVFAPVIFVFTTTMWGGNTVEEFLLPLNLLCIYYGILFMKGRKNDIGLAFFFGIVFMIGVLSKITVIAPMASVCLCVFIYLIYKKRFRDLFIAILLFICGCILVAAPVCIYFALRDSFDDFILAAFITAFKRSTDYYEGFSLKWESYLIICYACFVSFWGRIKYKGIEKWMLLSLSVVTFVALHFGTPFDYYFTTTIPLFAFSTILVCRDVKLLYFLKDKKFRYVLNNLILLVVGITISTMVYNKKSVDKIFEWVNLYNSESEYEEYLEFKEIFSLIPKNEQDDVFCIESGMIVYEVNQKLPGSKYPVNYPYFTDLYPPSYNQVLARLNKNPPKWIVSEGIETFELVEIRDCVMQKYKKILDNSKDQLWLRID